MKVKVKRSILVVAAILGIVLVCLASMSYWLPSLLNYWLPKGVSLSFSQRPYWHSGGLQLKSVKLQVDQCQLMSAEDLRIAFSQKQWGLTANKLAVDKDCFSQWPSSNDSQSSLTLNQIQSAMLDAQLTVENFTLSGLPLTESKLVLKLNKNQQSLQVINPQLQTQLQLAGHQLNIESLNYQDPATATVIKIHGKLTLGDKLTSLPTNGELASQLSTKSLKEPLTLRLTFNQQLGSLQVVTQQNNLELLDLPWQYQNAEFTVKNGKWSWPYQPQPAKGAIAFSVSDWQNSLQGPLFTARVNALTEGKGGKGNLVLSAGPGRIGLTNNALPLQLTGVAKALNLQIYTAIPAFFKGGITSPVVAFKPGSLLRARGEMLPGWIVDEARFPLAGVRLELNGITGPLQGNFKVRNNYDSFYLLYLSGTAHHFLPNKGRWDWRYWGKGKLLPLQANWDIAGRGFWQEKTIELTELTTGFNQLRYKHIRTAKPRLDLLKPIQWSTDKNNLDFSGAVRLSLSTMHLGATSQLPPSQTDFELQGKTPSQFRWKAEFQTTNGLTDSGKTGNYKVNADKDNNTIGPIHFSGRRNNAYWRGQALWPEQALKVIQPLLGDSKDLAVRKGKLKGAIAFSIQPGIGLQIGGHWRVKNAQLWTPNNVYHDIQFSLPFRYRQDRWQFGPKAPVNLSIGAIENQTTISNVHAELQGFYPYNTLKPLRLANVNLDLLGGSVHLPQLILPQQQAAKLKFSTIDLSKLITLLQTKQIAMSGHINAELPFWLTKNGWKIIDGWLKNAGDVTLRVDKDLIDKLINNNLAAGVAMDWLRYMEINKLEAIANVDTSGLLQLQGHIAGTSEFDHNRQRVRLNYTHQQNILTLWQSLSFGSNLESWLTENVRLPEKMENTQ